MAAIRPPVNTASISLPQNPTRPSALSDLSNALDYVENLRMVRKSGHLLPPTKDEIGAAMIYGHRLLHDHITEEDQPLWAERLIQAVNGLRTDVATLQTAVATVQTDVATIRTDLTAVRNDVNRLLLKANELPYMLSNSSAGTTGVLYNPAGGWTQPLGPPNPRTRDELKSFRVNQCEASAAALQLPPLPAGATVEDRRRQIAVKLGVSI